MLFRMYPSASSLRNRRRTPKSRRAAGPAMATIACPIAREGAMETGKVEDHYTIRPDAFGRFEVYVRHGGVDVMRPRGRFNPNAVHFAIRIAAIKSTQVVGCGARGRSG